LAGIKTPKLKSTNYFTALFSKNTRCTHVLFVLFFFIGSLICFGFTLVLSVLSVLQCAAAQCSVSQRPEKSASCPSNGCCNVLKRAADCCSVLQRPQKRTSCLSYSSPVLSYTYELYTHTHVRKYLPCPRHIRCLHTHFYERKWLRGVYTYTY